MGLSPPFPPTRHHSLAHLASKGQSDAHHLGRLSWYRLCLNCTCVQSGRAGRTCPPVLAFVVWLVVLAWLLCSACIVVVRFLNGVAHPLCWTVLLFCFRTFARTFGFFFALFTVPSGLQVGRWGCATCLLYCSSWCGSGGSGTKTKTSFHAGQRHIFLLPVPRSVRTGTVCT